MFESVKNKIQKAGLLALLQFIVTGTQSPAGYAFVPKAEAEKLAKAEPTFINIDLSVTNAEDQVKAVASQVAIDALNAATSPGTEAPPEKKVPAPMNYEIVTLTEMPQIMRGGHKADNYPFDKLTIFPNPGNSFFVPSTESKPNPAKSLASTVASATKRYATKDQRVFTVRKSTDAAKPGAFVIRTK